MTIDQIKIISVILGIVILISILVRTTGLLNRIYNPFKSKNNLIAKGTLLLTIGSAFTFVYYIANLTVLFINYFHIEIYIAQIVFSLLGILVLRIIFYMLKGK